MHIFFSINTIIPRVPWLVEFAGVETIDAKGP